MHYGNSILDIASSTVASSTITPFAVAPRAAHGPQIMRSDFPQRGADPLLRLLIVFILVLLVVLTSVLQAHAQEVPTPQPLPTHVVQPGETLSEIAQYYHVSMTRLMLFNGIVDANSVVAGQELTIPTSSAPNTATPSSTATLESSTATPTAIVTTTDVPTAIQTPTVVTSERTPAPSVATPDASASVGANADETEKETVDGPFTSALTPQDITTDPVLVAGQIASLNHTYTVIEGDTFARIALRTGVDPEALRQLNRLDPDHLNDLYIGQTLLLPATGDDLRVQRALREYVVEPGDSLGSIANQFDLSLVDLLAANFIADPDSLSVGQHLTIPQPTTAADTDGSNTLRVGPARSGFYYYTVQPGDNLSTLAQAFDSTKLALLEYNGLPDEETVYSGIELRIPYGPPTLPNRIPPVPTSGTNFVVSLSRQQCWLFRGNRVAREWTCSTGYGEWITRTGTFAVQSKIENAKSNAYRLDMPYWLGIYNVGEFENGIHGLPVEWDTGEKIWEGLIGEPATFGCAMLDDTDAAELFATAYIGMPIHVTN